MTGPGDDAATSGPNAVGARERLRRFAAAYRGDLAPADALFWAEQPLEASPAGSASPFAVHESHRRDLYRPGADPDAADEVRAEGERLARERRMIAGALDAADRARDAPAELKSGAGSAEDPAASVDASTPTETSVSPERTGAPRAVRGAAAAGVALVAAASILAVQAVRDELPVDSSSVVAAGSSLVPPNQSVLDPLPVPPIGDAAERASEREDTARLTSEPAASALGDYFQRHPMQRPGTLRDIRGSYAADLRGTATRLLRLGPGGELSIFVLCDRPSAYNLAIELRNGAAGNAQVLEVYGRGSDCSRLAYSNLGLGEGWSVTSVTVDTQPDVHYLLDAELAP